ncbi:tRNA (guanosine(46)-N7)-methyltransferase TrmB [Paraliobacillus sp. X-1268]|uniref:tRNA (guanosine(46)-N7)-methyltransferase TrmB n=1 Tax=Paraliobacillus sp. X-1268 TaxID=2213193 RepID=UPI000E3CA349|nr:tRNA (guanosine(46)-N7)-methyltransferase TrmB [Paraliobacillus sp. X-1268]
MRARYKPWALDFLKENEKFVNLNPSEWKNKWETVFQNNHPLHLEIGTGKGQFLMGMAKQFSNTNFIGIEVVESILVSAVQKAVETNPENVCFINEDAKDLRTMFGDNEIDKIYLNFSDPWPKARHAKRRLTHESFLEQYKQVLKTGGEIVLKTDNRQLFDYSVESFSQFGMKIEEVLLDLHEVKDQTNVMTEYEEKFSSKGQPIYRCRAQF